MMRSRSTRQSRLSWLNILKIGVLSLAIVLFLAACERPLQTIGEDEEGYPASTSIAAPTQETTEEAEPTVEPTIPQPAEAETEPAPTEMAPTATPGTDESPRTGDEGEQEATAEPTAEATVEATVEPTAEATPTASAEAGEERVHVVQPGENLYRIGLQYGVPWTMLAEYNNLANANDIEVGQEIRIPPTGGTDETPGATPAPEVTHVVQPGETLFIISQQYGVNWMDIAAANSLAAPYTIHAGDVLVIPGG